LRKTFRICGVYLMSVAFACSVVPQDPAAELHSRFAHQSDPVRKAKLMLDLGEVEFGQIREDAGDGNLDKALTLLQEYRDEAQSCANGLDARAADAEKHSSGFKQLQISLQESLRRLDALLVSMTTDEQAPFLDVRKDLDNMNRHVLEQLFPRRTPEKAATPENPEK
jgi:hypothetical protein